jgi:hypothetical protein
MVSVIAPLTFRYGSPLSVRAQHVLCHGGVGVVHVVPRQQQQRGGCCRMLVQRGLLLGHRFHYQRRVHQCVARTCVPGQSRLD